MTASNLPENLPPLGPLVGTTVNEIRAKFADAFQIPPDAPAFANGEPVDGEYRLKADDLIEFVRGSAGQIRC